MGMRALVAGVAIVLSSFAPAVHAADLRVAPVMVRVPAGSNTGTVRLWNDDSQPLNVQVRVFRWTVTNGQETLEPTRDVVASPPMATLAPGSENLIRVVRVSHRPVVGQERYRLIIDQLPKAGSGRTGTVNILVRHAIPVYFE